MTTVMAKDTRDIGLNESIFTEERKTQIREALKQAAGYEPEGQSEKYESEMHHKEEVPFEGNVYTGAGNSLDTKEIDKLYRKSLPSLWWIASQSLLALIRRLAH